MRGLRPSALRKTQLHHSPFFGTHIVPEHFGRTRAFALLFLHRKGTAAGVEPLFLSLGLSTTGRFEWLATSPSKGASWSPAERGSSDHTCATGSSPPVTRCSASTISIRAAVGTFAICWAIRRSN